MIDLREIEKTIAELKQGKTTFENCERLASLYIVRDHLKEQSQEIAPISMTKVYTADSNTAFTMEIAQEWTRAMKNEDGTSGEHWNAEQVKKLMLQRGVDYNLAEVYAIINSLYSDYSKVMKKYGISSPEFYLDLALAFLNDKDAKKNKALNYYEHIVR